MPLIALPGGSRVNLVRAGPRGGSPVVLMHAVGLDLTWWDRQVEGLCRDYDVAAFDAPHHGSSDGLGALPTFERLAAVAAAVVEHLDAGPAHVVGISMSGMVAQMLALARPDLVRSLTLVATLCTFPDPVRAALRERARVAREEGMAAIAPLSLERWFPLAFRERRPDVLDRAEKTLRGHDAQAHAAFWEMIAKLDFEARLSALRCPTLVVAGAQDGNAPPAAGQRIAELIPGAVLHVVPDVGHFPPVEAPDAFNGLLRGFLAAAPVSVAAATVAPQST